MKRHISIFALLLSAFAAVGLAGAARAGATTNGGWFFEDQYKGSLGGGQTPVYLTRTHDSSKSSTTFTAINPAGMDVTKWGTSLSSAELQQGHEHVTWSGQTGQSCSWEDSELSGTTVVAVRFDYIPFNVTFNGNGGSGSMDPITGLNIISNFTLTANSFKKTGCHFIGWNTNQTSDVAFKDKDQVKGSDLWNGKSFNSTFYAQWEADGTILLDNHGADLEEGTTSVIVAPGNPLPKISVPRKTGNDFDGYYEKENGQGEQYWYKNGIGLVDDWQGLGVTTAHAAWVAHEYKIVYSNLGDASDYPESAEYGEEILLPEPVRRGLTFAGWNIAAGLKSSHAEWHQSEKGWSTISTSYDRLQAGEENPVKTVWLRNLNTNNQETVTVNANWTTNSYKINLKFEGVNNNPTKEISVEYGAIPDGVGVVPSYDSGMVFTGYVDSQGQLWYDEEGKLTAEFADYHWDRTEDLELTAQKGGIEYYITYDANAKHGGNGTEPKQTCNTAGEVTLSDGLNMSNPHHSLVGWSKNQDTLPRDVIGTNFVPGGHPSYSELGVTKATIDITLYAIWKDRRVTIGINATGGKAFTNGVEVTEIVYVDGEKYGFLPTAERLKYKFDGWYSAATGGTLIEPDMIVSKADVPVLYAHWSPEKFHVRFDGNGASNETEMAVQEFVFNEEKPLLPNEYGRVGYDFTGWTTNATDKTKVYEDGQMVSNLTETVGATNVLYALWDPHHYTITFRANGGKGEMTSHGLAYDQPYTLPECTFAAPKFCTFLYWSTSATDASTVYHAGETVSNLTAEADGTVPLYAIWKYDVGPWSEVLDCNNLMFFNDLEKDSEHKWKIVQEGVPGTTSTESAMHNKVGRISRLYADIDESGTISYCWKGEGSGYPDDPNYLSVCTNDIEVCRHNMVDDTDWTTNKFYVDVVPGQIVRIQFTHNDFKEVYLDCVTWTPDVKVPTAVEGLVYDGTEKTGVLPGVGYSLVGNVATNAGDYTAVATVTNSVWEGGATGATNILWTIAKATYDMSGVTFASATYEWDGKEHSIAVVGVPSGVEVVYTGDATNRTEVGTNTVTASFKVLDELNYNAITTQMVATLAITSREDPPVPPEPPEPVVTNAVPVAVTGLVYDGNAKTGVAAGANYMIVGNVATNAGGYTAVATVTNGVWEGGATGPTNIAWTIAKGTHDMSGVTFASATYEFDGKEHSIAVAGVPPGVEVVYSGDATNRTEVGTNTVTASFKVLDELNYNAIATQMVATLAITSREEPPVPPEPPEPVVTNAVPTAVPGLVYDGTAKTGVAEGANYAIVGNVATNAGDYTAVATVTNGVWEGGATGATNIAWTIAKATYDMGGVTFASATYEFDGKPHSIAVAGVPSGAEVVYTGDATNRTEVGTNTVTASFRVLDEHNYNAITTQMVATLAITAREEPPEPPEPPDPTVAYENIYFKATLAELGAEAVPTNRRITIKAEGLPKGLKLVTMTLKDAKKKATGYYAYTVEGAPTETMDGLSRIAYVRVTDNKVQTLYALDLSVLWAKAYEDKSFPDGEVKSEYANFSVTNLWPDVAVNPKNWTFSGLPAGIKYATKAVTSRKKINGVYVTLTNALAYEIYGTPTKAGRFTVKATEKIVGTSYKSTHVATFAVWPEGSGPTDEWTDQAYVDVYRASATDVKSVSGLPTGIKFTSKDITSKGVVVTGAHHFYGKPTKAGTFAVTLTHDDKSKTQFLWTITPAAAPAFELKLTETAVDPATAKATIRQGVSYEWAVDNTLGSKVSASGLPSGLSLKSTAIKDGKTTIGYAYSVKGVPTKAGEYFVTFKTTMNGVTVVTTAAFTVLDLPAWAQGTFNGGADGSFPSGGQANLTLSKVGKLSGKWMSTGTNWTLSAASYDRYDPKSGSYVALMIGKTGSGKKAVTFTNELVVSEADAEYLGGVATNALFIVYQNVWKTNPWKTIGKKFAKAGAVILHPGVVGTNDTITLKFATSGAVTIVGKFEKSVSSKGKVSYYSASASAVLCPQGDPDEYGVFDSAVFIYFPPKAKTPLSGGYSACVWVRWDGSAFAELPLVTDE